jgi:hypothetical protein
MGRLKAIVLFSILGIFGATGAWAVGYERLEVSREGNQPKTVVTEAAGNGFMQKYPALLDETASVIRDILSQFGLINTKTP